jgi:hypothetical protein
MRRTNSSNGSSTAATGAAAVAPARAALALTPTAAKAAAAMLLAAAFAAAPARADWAVHKEEKVEKTFTLVAAGGARTVEVDNVTGNVRVRAGRAGGGVALSVHESWGADSAERLEAGQREVRLDITETAGRLRLYVDGPFRSRDGHASLSRRDHPGYEAKFDFDLEVPADVDVVARTVNGGEVRVAGISGRFEVRNVNGPVKLERVGGAGSARSVNGSVVASFTRNPPAGCSFETVNGRIEVTFQPGLAADLRLRTLNGEVFTDYDYTYHQLAPEAAPAEHAPAGHPHGHYHYRSRGEFGARIAGGGPEMAFRTINGDIVIRRQGA